MHDRAAGRSGQSQAQGAARLQPNNDFSIAQSMTFARCDESQVKRRIKSWRSVSFCRQIGESQETMAQSAIIVAILKFVISLANAFKQETEELVG